MVFESLPMKPNDLLTTVYLHPNWRQLLLNLI